jgi:hypothetical protein
MLSVVKRFGIPIGSGSIVIRVGSDLIMRELNSRDKSAIEFISQRIDFINVKNLINLEFGIEYWLPDRQVSMCGHGPIAACMP